MKLNVKRITRYLGLQKKVNNFLLKLHTKDRENLVKLMEISSEAVKLEQKLRDFQQILVNNEQPKN